MAALQRAHQSDFDCDLEFCSECGSILPLPGLEPVVKCKQCSKEIDASAFDGLTIVTRVVFNKLEKKTEGLTSEDFSGPKVDRKCPKCGSEDMTYHTRQTRSADEGQTVFYTCLKCRFQETEYS